MKIEEERMLPVKTMPNLTQPIYSRDNRGAIGDRISGDFTKQGLVRAEEPIPNDDRLFKLQARA